MGRLQLVGACLVGGAVAAIPLPGSFGGAYLVTDMLFPECPPQLAIERTFILCALTGKIATIALLIACVATGILTSPFALGLTLMVMTILSLNLALFAHDLCSGTSTHRANARATPLRRGQLAFL